MPFSKLGLSNPIVTAVAEQGYTTPTPIQAKSIPVILSGRNLIAAAQTGTGKTASFVLPILQILSQSQTQRKKRIRALILTPTRELAVQVEANIAQYGKHLDLTSMAMYGGVDAEPQRQGLLEGVDILVATPGRLLDMYTQRAIHFDELEILVLDEADRMLDMGFIEDIDKIMDKLPTDRQSLLFSATLSHQVKALAKTTVDRPVEISVIANTDSKPKIEQWLITVDKDKKSALLSHLIKENDWQQALIFIETKQGAAKLVSQLEKRGITAECIHGGRSQEVREKILADFKAGNIGLLVATGVAARGLDIDELPLVINYDLPYPADDYIHRIGRTGRAGANGQAVSLVSRDDFKNLCMIESRLGKLIERREIDGFTPQKDVPISVLNFKPKFKTMTEKSQDMAKREPKRSANTAADKKRNGQQDSKSKANKDANKLPLNPWNV
ncbi:DEAD/DEAH box helicase [Shewanella sp. Choline-02u-19]|uniref:DEAD/DEAH box helicase n=1 Tax=unclassified Shewanella TaxID=196818 RepID=UPI000C3376A0|nr:MULTISPECIES: DEAD/DEAH box helicase [unclassified Shewanella]PKH54898.1 DEAD/DEAH box helicase [Shewanella sp. Bg11-22]PKI26670.1 DEAD/DEAH box helicase [Shewanella sp. Choline-02u-19]